MHISWKIIFNYFISQYFVFFIIYFSDTLDKIAMYKIVHHWEFFNNQLLSSK